MRKMSEVQTTLIRLRKKYTNALKRKDTESIIRLDHAIHALEWVLEMQNTITSNPTD